MDEMRQIEAVRRASLARTKKPHMEIEVTADSHKLRPHEEAPQIVDDVSAKQPQPVPHMEYQWAAPSLAKDYTG